MKKLLLLLAATRLFAAYQSISYATGASNAMTVPNNAPFTSIGDYRFAIRLHDWVAPGSGSMTMLNFGVMTVTVDSTNRVCANNFGDGMPAYGNSMCFTGTGLNDVTIRPQRFGNSYPNAAGGGTVDGPGSFWMDAYDNTNKAVLTTYCGSSGDPFGCPIGTANTRNITGANGVGANTAFQIAYAKWFSTTVAPGTPITETESVAADVADFRYEGNFNNLVSSSVTYSTGSGTVTYPGTRVQAPNCIIGNQTFRSGFPAAAVVNNYSYPLNGDASITRQYWNQLTGPTTLRFVPNPWSASVSLYDHTGTGAGNNLSYQLQLQVIDSSNASTSCTAKMGFVATDSNYIVTTGNAAMDTILGPQIMFGQNPNAYADTRQAAEDAIQIANVATYYGGANPYWATASTHGTVTLTQGSTTVTGSGTQFQTDFGGGTSTPVSGLDIMFFYPTSTSIAPSGFGRRYMSIASIPSQTQIILNTAWNPTNSSRVTPNSTTGAISNIQYTISNQNNDTPWYGQNSQANFYEAGNALAASRARSGIDDTITAFRTFEKNYLTYRLDFGNSLIYGDSVIPQFGNIYFSPNVLAMYALDQGSSQAWQTLEQWESWIWSGTSPHLPWPQNQMISQYCGAVCDARDISYQIRLIASVALFDPGAYAATARSHLDQIITQGIIASADQSPSANLKYSHVFYWDAQGGDTPMSNSQQTNSTVACTHGSNTCTCNAGTCNFSSGWCTGNPGPAWAFSNAGTSFPSNNDNFIGGAYFPASCTSTTVTLDRNFSGPNGTYGWWVGYYRGLAAGSVVGFGCQPYECGLLVGALDLARQALTCTSAGVPTNCDSTTAAALPAIEKNITDFLSTKGYNSTYAAPFYFADFVNGCLTGTGHDADANCLNGFVVGQARNDTCPMMDGIIRGYSANPTAALKSFGDLMLSSVFNRAGYGLLSGQSPDNGWVTGYDDGYGYNIIGTPPQGQAHKYYGMCWGVGHTPAWYGARIGGLTAPVTQQIYVSGNIAGVASASKMQVTVTEPTGVVDAPVVCASAPCVVAVNKSIGNYMLTVDYLNSSNVVLTHGKPYLVTLE